MTEVEALQMVERIAVARLKPTDVIVIESTQPMSQSTIANIEERLKGIWPGTKVVVMCDGLKMKIVDGER